jgi:sulfide:quinone oxidoreductase
MTNHHHILIVGGGTAGVTVAAQLRRAGQSDIAIIEPSQYHYYQPLWTLVGGGRAKLEPTRRPQASVTPKGVTWIRKSAVSFEPENNAVITDDGSTYTYDGLIVAPGIQLDWDHTPGLTQTLGTGGVSSNYRYDLAPRTWDFIRGMRSGTAIFTMPTDPIKCGGAPQKIAYLAADHWRKAGVLDQIDIHLVVPSPRIFGIPEIADELDKVIDDFGITLHTEAALSEIDPENKRAIIRSVADDRKFDIDYDMMHVVPHQSAPDWIKSSPLSTGDALGYVEVDKFTLQHPRHPNIFALGDAAGSPNSKTGAAVRKQAPAVTQNIISALSGHTPTKEYHGYSSCPLTVGHNKMLLAEFDYSMQRTPSIPLINTLKPRHDMWLLKKYGLPFIYWNLMLKGRV